MKPFENSNNPLEKTMNNHPYPHFQPLAQTVALLCLITIIGASVGLGVRLLRPAELQDHYLDGELLQGLDWLNRKLQAKTVPMLQTNNAECDPRLTARLQRIADYTGRTPHINLQVPDCALTPVVNKATTWLLQDPQRIKTLTSMPTRSLGDWIDQADPFRLPGCLYIKNKSGKTIAKDGYCLDTPEWQHAQPTDLPQHSPVLWTKLSAYRQARLGVSPNIFHYSVAGLDTPLAQGRQQWLTLDSAVQNQSQQTADCYTGELSACKTCPWCNDTEAATFYGHARARMLGILVVDVATGGIVAAASSHSPCYAAQHSGYQLAGCPKLPSPPARRPRRLVNHALEHEVMPASLIKIPLAAALMEADIPVSARTAMAQDWLVYSDTEAFIDTVLCKDQQFKPECAQQRLSRIQTKLAALGWNKGCDGIKTGCARQDLLASGQVTELDYPVLTGRLLLGLNNAPLKLGQLRLNAKDNQLCYQQGQKTRWRECRGADLIDTLAELYGQGQALSTPVGIADLLLQLAAAEAGLTAAPQAHLLQQTDSQSINPSRPIAMQAATAHTIITALSQTPLRGTAHAACLKAAIPGGMLQCQTGSSTALRLAGKTGTPLFPDDGLTLAQWRTQCSQLKGQTVHQQARCGYSPYKWFALLVGKPNSSVWDKAIVVLAERNWNQQTGQIDSVDDKGSNIAAEVGLVIANALFSPVATR